MSFNVLFMAHAPDADRDRHRSEIDTGKLRLVSVIVQNQEEALGVAKEVFREENIDSILLCPGFTHSAVAEIFDALDGQVAVAVARSDGPSSRITAEAMRRAEYFAA
ncbi:MAG: DUF6506 family protein [Anaerolineae bacterium]